MQLLVYSDLRFDVYDLDKVTQIYLPKKPYQFKISKNNHEYFLEIDGNSPVDIRSSTRKLRVKDNFCVEDLTIIVRKKPIHYERYCLKETIFIGREEGCDIVYNHNTVSKNHARIFYDGRWYIEDLDSKNGVYLNQKRVGKALLKIGDCISISGFDLYFNDVFLCSVVPSKTTLINFTFHTMLLQNPPQQELHFIEIKDEPQIQMIEKKGTPISFFRDVIIPLIYPTLIYYETKNISPFLWMSILVVVLRIIEKIINSICYFIQKWWMKYRFRQKVKSYQQYLEDCFPTCEQLQKWWILPQSYSLQVRLGKAENKLILHDFEMYPKLVLVGNKDSCEKLLVSILYQLERYQLLLGVEMKEILFPFYLCHSRLYPKNLMFSLNTHEGKYRIDYEEHIVQLKDQYDAILHVDEGWYFTHQQVYLDIDKNSDLLLLARNFNSLEIKDKEKRTFLDACGLKHRGIKEIRRQQQSLQGILGWSDNHPVYLDLSENKDGPHILVAGMSGSGKSEWLTSYLFSLAIFFDTCDVQFLIIDFKGGALSHLLEKLHHTCQSVSNLDEYQIHRTIAALQLEVVEREKKLLSLSKDTQEPILDIYQFNQKIEDKQHKMFHLLVVVDEFAELKLMYPEMMQSLVRIARTGRSLGIHLILCTQRPNGIIDRQIESNIQTRICMKVASKQDSYDVLGNDKASTLTKTGQWICMNGQNLIQGTTAFVDELQQNLVLYDLNLNEVKTFFKIEPMKMKLIERINQESLPVPLLYPKTLQKTTIPKDCFGLYDDYQTKRVVPFTLMTPSLIIGGALQGEGEEIECVSSYTQVNLKKLETMKMVLFFDEKAIEQLLFKKVPFSIDKETRIGALYYQRRLYQCKIQSCVI